jgi:hypothetical protein
LVHQALQHLEDVGFPGAPRFLGIDHLQREALTFVSGQVAGRPWPQWVADLERARSVARLVRRLDDAMVLLGVPDDGVVPEPSPEGMPARVGPPPTFLGHRDFAPENVVFEGRRAVAFIDFDMLKPSSRVDEVGNLLLWWAPLMPPVDREPVLRDADPFMRTREIVTAYGLDEGERSLLVASLSNAAQRSWYLMREWARTRGGGWQRMWDEGVGERIVRRRSWLTDNRRRLEAAVRG